MFASPDPAQTAITYETAWHKARRGDLPRISRARDLRVAMQRDRLFIAIGRALFNSI